MPEIKKGKNSAKNVGGVTISNYLERYQSYRADIISIRKITKGNNFVKNVGGVTIFNLCMLSGQALYFYEVL